jgi:hypothetical protein
LDEVLDVDEEKEDDIPAVPETPRVQLGDVFELGSHRLICGDATNLETVEQLVDGQQADLVITDPPYNVNYE